MKTNTSLLKPRGIQFKDGTSGSEFSAIFGVSNEEYLVIDALDRDDTTVGVYKSHGISVQAGVHAEITLAGKRLPLPAQDRLYISTRGGSNCGDANAFEFDGDTTWSASGDYVFDASSSKSTASELVLEGNISKSSMVLK